VFELIMVTMKHCRLPQLRVYSNILCDWKVENVQWQISRQLITSSVNKHTQMSQETGCQREGKLKPADRKRGQ